MKRSDVNLDTLLNQLSEEKINRVVDSNLLRAAGSSTCQSSDTNESQTAEDEPASGGISIGGGISVGVGVSGGLGLGI